MCLDSLPLPSSPPPFTPLPCSLPPFTIRLWLLFSLSMLRNALAATR